MTGTKENMISDLMKMRDTVITPPKRQSLVYFVSKEASQKLIKLGVDPKCLRVVTL